MGVDMQDAHVLIVDYDEGRRDRLAALLQQQGAHTHLANSRIEAAGLMFRMISSGTYPRAVLTSWLFNDADRREFYSSIGAELEHTSLRLVLDVLKIDSAISQPELHTVVIVYGADDDDVFEANKELQAAGVARMAGVVCYEQLLDAGKLPGLLFAEDRHQRIQDESQEALCGVTVGVDERPNTAGSGSGSRKCVKLLSGR